MDTRLAPLHLSCFKVMYMPSSKKSKEKRSFSALPWVALIAGILNLYGMHVNYEKETAYENGLSTTGVIVAISEHGGRFKKTRTKVQVEYADQNGETHRAFVESAYGEARRVGQRMNISYVPGQYSLVRAPDERIGVGELRVWIAIFGVMIVWGLYKIVGSFFARKPVPANRRVTGSETDSENFQAEKNIYNSPIAYAFLASIPIIVLSIMFLFDNDRYATTAIVLEVVEEGSMSKPQVEYIDEELNTQRATIEETDASDRLIAGAQVPIFYWPTRRDRVQLDRRDPQQWFVFYILFATTFIGGSFIVGKMIRNKVDRQAS